MKKVLASILAFLFLAVAQVHSADIAVVTLAAGDNYQSAVKTGIDNKRAYCQKHGYDFIVGTESLDKRRPFAWSKVLLLLKVMENPTYKWVFWTDADSLIMNTAIPLEDLIDDNYYFIISFDKLSNVVNSGQFFLKNCPESKAFLKRVYDHIECIRHPWWENQAIILELQRDKNLKKNTKIIAQRLINSYPSESNRGIEIDYHPGDFIVHFAGCHDLKELGRLFAAYSPKIVDNQKMLSLDFYLMAHGYDFSTGELKVPFEGFVTSSQKEQFNECLKSYPPIKTIAEIGLNGGQSLFNIIENSPQLEKIVSFDIIFHPYTSVAVQYFKRFYKDIFVFVEGDSGVKVPEYAKQFPLNKFDLIYIDGDHSYKGSLADIQNCRALAHSNTILWIDDYLHPDVNKAVRSCVSSRILEIIAVHTSHDPELGERCWIEAKYVQK